MTHVNDMEFKAECLNKVVLQHGHSLYIHCTLSVASFALLCSID